MALITVRITQNGAGTFVIEPAAAGFRAVVVSFSLDIPVATALPQFESGATVIAGPYGTVPGMIYMAGTRQDPLFAAAMNQNLELVLAGTGLVSGHVTYFMERVIT